MVHALDIDQRLSFEEYLEFEESTDVRYELVEGHLYAFAGASARHNLIAGEIFGLLRAANRRSECKVFTHAMRLRVSSKTAYYPDIMVTCDPDDNDELYRDRPCVIVEVLSPSTMLVDRREKLVTYQTIASLQAYLIVHRDRCRVESYLRSPDGTWEYTQLNETDEVWFPCVDLRVPVKTLYEEVEMPTIRPVTDEPEYR